jgi:hypothetical protein
MSVALGGPRPGDIRLGVRWSIGVLSSREACPYGEAVETQKELLAHS